MEIPSWNSQDTLVIKAPKKTPLALRMVVLLFAVVCGVYILSICLKQTSTPSQTNSLNIQVFDHPCQAYGIQQWQIPYVHFPKPKTFRRNECACNPVRPFAIVSMQGSRSGWFETLLNSHVNVSSNGEIFSVRDRRTNVTTILKTLDKVYNLDWFTSPSKNECSAAVGLKWMLNQIFLRGMTEHHKEIVEYFNKRGVSVIFLFRKNLLRRMISVLANSYDKEAKLLNGTHKSHVHSPYEAKILARYKSTINATLLIPSLKEAEKTAAKALQYFKNTRHIVLYYEDIITNHTKLVEVQEFLRLPYRDLTSQQIKIHRRPLSKQIENWKDVRKALKGTSFQSFLRADYQL